ncbi:TraG-like protein, partial [Candidatus Regiella insecticola 5.15]
KGYVFTLAYLQSWPLLFAIMNNAMNFYLKTRTTGTPVTLSNLSMVQQQYSDIGTTAGWLALSIPFLAYGIVKGLGSAVSQAGSYLGSAMQSAATQSSSQAVDGTWSLNNLQTDNVQGHKWDTNSAFSQGQMTSQVGSGALVTQTGSGQRVYNTTSALSKLPMDIHFGRTESSTAQRLARESQIQAESALAGFNHTSNSAYNQAKQFSQQTGNSATVTRGIDSAQGTSETQAVNQMLSAAKSYAEKNNISESQAFTELNNLSRRAELSGSAMGRVDINSDRHIFGKVAGLATGVAAGVEFRGGVSGTASNASTRSTDEKATRSQDHSIDQSSQEANDFRQGRETLKSFRTSQSGSHSDNTANAQIEQLGTTLSVADSQYQQYTTGLNRNHEYSQMASAAQTTRAQTHSNYAQEFVNYVQSHSPARAEAILTDTASPTVRAEREALAGQFMEDKLRARVEGHFNNSRAQLRDGMSDVSNTVASVGENAYQQGNAAIQSRIDTAGIRADNTHSVDAMMREGKQHISNADREISASRNGINRELQTLNEAHQSAENKFDNSYGDAMKHKGEDDPRLAKTKETIDSAIKKHNLDK